jgi:hypothetical protein
MPTLVIELQYRPGGCFSSILGFCKPSGGHSAPPPAHSAGGSGAGMGAAAGAAMSALAGLAGGHGGAPAAGGHEPQPTVNTAVSVIM